MLWYKNRLYRVGTEERETVAIKAKACAFVNRCINVAME